MKLQALRQAIELARKTGWILVATGDAEGTPHVAAASRIDADETGEVTLGGWFCPATVSNLQENKRISLVVWKSSVDKGFQLVGDVQRMEELAVLDGNPAGEAVAEVPQVERILKIRVSKVLGFTHAPHLDVEK